MSILSSQADPPTFKNDGFIKTGARFSKNHGFGSKGALDGVLGLWHLACSKLLSGLPSWPNLLFFFVSSFAPFLEVFVFLIFEPLGVDFELSR